MTVRILTTDEWARLAEETPTLNGATLNPTGTLVIVVEMAGRIVACWAAMTTVHVEGLWVDPAYQHGAGVQRALLRKMVEEMQEAGQREVLTQAADPRIAKMLEQLGGQPVPGTTYVFPLGVLEVA